jgi:chitinase
LKKVLNISLLILANAFIPAPVTHAQLPAQPNCFNEILTNEIYDQMFPHSNSLYSYDNLVKAAQDYPSFCNEGSLEQRKRELAAFLANIAHETTGGWASAPDGPYAWGLYFIEEVNQENWPNYCDATNTRYACVPGQTYHGRGPIQLSWNYNYGQVGEVLGVDLLANPDLVKSDGVIAFKTALWFWMTPQSPKPSAHAVMTGEWTPSDADVSAGRNPGFGMTINIINGGLECGSANATNPDAAAKVNDRVGFYQRFTDTNVLNVGVGKNVYCNSMEPYGQ